MSRWVDGKYVEVPKIKDTSKEHPGGDSDGGSYSIEDALDRDYAKNGGKPAPVPSGRK
jgi:hypothetical protein